MLKITNYQTYTQLFEAIDASTSIITPNRRLSATLHKLYQQYQANKQKQAWLTPDILPVFSWIQRFFNELTQKEFISYPLLLNTLQEQFIWETILTNAKENDFLLQISETAELAKSAWYLLKQWQVDIQNPIFMSAEDYVALKNWATQFQAICKNGNWIDSASLPDLLITKMEDKIIEPAANIMLVGFTELSPQLNRLFAICKKRGSDIHLVEMICDPISSERISLMDEENEFLSMARFAKSIATKHPFATIGCVIPSLNNARDRIKQIFSEVFAAENSYTVSEQESPFNISAGKSLLQYPIIHTALQLLSLHKKIIPIEILSYLLTSPFLGEAESERIKRAHYDSLLRQANVNHIDVIELINENNDQSLSLAKNCNALAKRLRRFFSLLNEQDKKQSYTEWVILFNQYLSILGWPGERSLSSIEYQIVENWLHFLSEYMTLDQVSEPVHFHQVLQKLYKMVTKTTFQPQSPETNIQILGVLEAAALPFDYLWVAGMDDLSWPPQPKPNPFIPKSLQRELQMPHATAERELLYCKQLTKQFKHSAKHIIFSHAEKNADLKLQPSPLIEDLPHLSIEELSLIPYQSPSQRIYVSKITEYFLDQKGPAPLPDEKIVGGVDLIKQQALCPFKAFAKHRLKAHELESPMLGLRPKDRGNIIHKILEIIWNQLQNHATLVSLTEVELNAIIQNAIHTAISLFSNGKQSHTQYLLLEKQRLFKLIQDWMQIEKNRDAFKIATNEKTTQLTLNQLKLTIRIDRIDELPDGKKIIIDYKTGKNNEISSWFTHRPDEPQLPLYSLLDPDMTAAIAFAQVASGEHCFKGISRFALDIKGVKLVSEIKKTTALSWDEQINQWKTILTQLCDDFYQGKATVDPKESQTCMWCALKPLCRVNEEITPPLKGSVN